MSRKEWNLNEELKVENHILDESNKKLPNALQNKDLSTVFVAQAMIETAHKKIKSTNKGMVLNHKSKEL